MRISVLAIALIGITVPGVAAAGPGLSSLTWLSGQWARKDAGGLAEEHWSTPAGGAMMGMFRLVKDGKVVFYELLTITEEGGKLVLRIRHLDSALNPWASEAKGPLTYRGKAGKGKAVFHNKTDKVQRMEFSKRGKNRLRIRLVSIVKKREKYMDFDFKRR